MLFRLYSFTICFFSEGASRLCKERQKRGYPKDHLSEGEEAYIST